MSDNTKIEWTDATWNPITGCSVTSPGCKHCYAMQLAGTRLKHHESRIGLTQDTSAGPVWTGEVRLNSQWLDQPLRWKKPRKIFVCAHSDLFHESVPDEWIDIVLGIMWACLYGRDEKPSHIFQVLTKRASRMRHYFSTDRREAWARAAVNYGGGIDPDGIWDQVMGAEGPHPRIWLGVSVEDQKRADERIPELLATPAAVRWVSAEPMLGPVAIWPYTKPHCERHRGPLDADGKCEICEGRGIWGLDDHLDESEKAPIRPGIDWVIVGGESGSKARPMHPQWVRGLRDQCADAGVSFLFKQWGSWAPPEVLEEDTKEALKLRADQTAKNAHVFDDGQQMGFVGKKAAGRLLDGVQHDGYPSPQ